MFLYTNHKIGYKSFYNAQSSDFILNSFKIPSQKSLSVTRFYDVGTILGTCYGSMCNLKAHIKD